MKREYDTLKSRLAKLEQFKESGKEFKISLPNNKLSDAEAKIFKEFYEKNTLASKVAEGTNSYTQLIKPVEEKYSTFWKRIWTPKKDKVFDSDIRNFLGSMNDVGEAYIDTELYTTSGRKKVIRTTSKYSLFFGAFFSALLGFVTYGIPHQPPNIYWGILEKSLPLAVLPFCYGIFKITPNDFMKGHLKHLKIAAQRTDEFLRQNYFIQKEKEEKDENIH